MATFDSLASSYDTDFTHSAIGTHLRKRVHQRLLKLWHPDDHILEVGCGTGEDALFLGTNDIRLTATDASPNMLQVTENKTSHLETINTQLLDLARLPTNDFNMQYDGVLSNFGALNCIADWKSLATWLSTRVKTGGTLAFAIMSPYCVWETLWHGLHFDIKTATRRWRDSANFIPDANTTLEITYPTVKRLTTDFAPHFQRTYVYPLGLFLPPSDVYPVIEKRQRILKLLTELDDRFANTSKLALFADHYWIEFKRI